MARKRKYSKRSSGLGSVKSIVKKAGMGMLGAMVVGAVAKKVAPQYASIAGIGGAYLAGGPVGALATVFIQGVPSLTGSSNGNGVYNV